MHVRKDYRWGGIISMMLLLSSQVVLASKVDTEKEKSAEESVLVTVTKAPNFSLPGISKPGISKEIQLSKYRGKVVYVDFWASWCIPCRKSFTWMNEMQDRYGDKGLTIIAVNLDESHHNAKTFLEQYPAQFSVAFDPKGHTAELYEVRGMPSSYLIGPDGGIAYRHLGFRPADKRKLEVEIDELVSAL